MPYAWALLEILGTACTVEHRTSEKSFEKDEGFEKTVFAKKRENPPGGGQEFVPRQSSCYRSTSMGHVVDSSINIHHAWPKPPAYAQDFEAGGLLTPYDKISTIFPI